MRDIHQGLDQTGHRKVEVTWIFYILIQKHENISCLLEYKFNGAAKTKTATTYLHVESDPGEPCNFFFK